MVDSLSTGEIILRLVLGAVLSGLIGVERERLERAAGLRTHALVGVGSTLIMIVSAFGFSDILGSKDVVLDPSRIAAQVVSGIGFLGAGTIIFQREVVRGLTTAASIWAVAGIGLAVGGGLYLAAVAGTAVILIILAGIRPIEHRFFPHNRAARLSIEIEQRPGSIFAIEQAINEAGCGLDSMRVQPGEGDRTDIVDIVLKKEREGNMLAAVDRLRAVHGIRNIEISRNGLPH